MFTYNIQLAGYAYEKFDEKGETNFNEFSNTFDTFPWLDQLDAYDKIKEGCSATISVKSINADKDFWISIAGDRKKYFFLVGLVYMKIKKGLWGFGKEKAVRWVDIYEIEDRDKIKSLFRLFFDNKIDNLESELLNLRKFDSMKAFVQ
jgi:hypothetical protein